MADKITNKLLIIFLLSFGTYPLIPERQESLVVVFLVIISFWIFFRKKDKASFNVLNFLLPISIFLIFLLSATLSDDVSKGFRRIETMFSLLIIPLVFHVLLYGHKINLMSVKKIFFKIYYISNIVYCFFAINVFNNYKNPKYIYKDSNFFRNALIDVPLIGEHPIYISVFLAIAILIGFTLYNLKNKVINNVFIGLGQSFILIILILLMSKSVILALFLSGVVWVLLKYKKRIYILSFLLFILISIILFIPKSNNRLKDLFDKVSYTQLDLNNSTSMRISILKCNIDLISKNPLFGYGLGDVQQEMDDCYASNGYDFFKGQYNTHNQYFFVWLSCGILGLLVFFAFLYYYYRIAILNRDYLMLSILVLYSVVFMFENILSRQSGVIFFSFLISFMSIIGVKNKESNFT
ncbi:MAG: O-antigen ligase family protein [Algibacter sp.]